MTMELLDNGSTNAGGDGDVPRVIHQELLASDRRYQRITRGAGSLSLFLMGAIGLFLLVKSWDAISVGGTKLITDGAWAPMAPQKQLGVGSLLFGTILVALVGLIIAVPVSIGAALFLTEIVPRRAKTLFVSLVDLLAAVPSLLFGLWGVYFLAPRVIGLSSFLNKHLNWVPFFGGKQTQFEASIFIAGLIISLMVIPICTSIMREVFAQAPPAEREAALALGGTRWGMIRTVVLPFGRGGIIGGTMLGLGRALGETIAVALILGNVSPATWRILGAGGSTVSSAIALTFPDSDEFGISALMAAGVALFILTLVVNLFASAIVSRSRSGQGVEL